MRALALLVVLPTLFAGCLGPVVGAGPDALDFASSRDYRKWVVEVDSATGKEPSQALLNFLRGRLTAVVDKPDGIEFRTSDSLTGTDRPWSTAQLLSLSREHLDAKTGGNTVVLHLLFVAGHSDADSGDNKVLGVAIGHGLIVIFSDSVASMCQGAIIPGTCSTAPFFESVTLHEFGHAIGLVNNGVPMVRPHEAASCNGRADKGHSSNRDSVMFCAAEQSALFGNLFGNDPPNDFDADDKADLRAMQK